MEVFKMKAISYTAVRAELAKTMKKVCEDHDPIIITRKNNEAVGSRVESEKGRGTKFTIRLPHKPSDK